MHRNVFVINGFHLAVLVGDSQPAAARKLNIAKQVSGFILLT
jgi:hypothetical protein